MKFFYFATGLVLVFAVAYFTMPDVYGGVMELFWKFFYFATLIVSSGLVLMSAMAYFTMPDRKDTYNKIAFLLPLSTAVMATILAIKGLV